MITDPPPRAAKLRKQYDASEKQLAVTLPPAPELRERTVALGDALRTGESAAVKRAGQGMLEFLAGHYAVPTPPLLVLGVRPHKVYDGQLSYELFGDYAPGTTRIRVWMRTAILGKVTSHKGLLNTLLHEFCHHLDVRALGYEDTPHTRGFYTRIDHLYHLALGTPDEARKPLVWRKRGSVWVIDWAAVRAGKR